MAPAPILIPSPGGLDATPIADSNVATKASFYARQAATTVTVTATPDCGGGTNLSGGAIAGIVIGSVVGTLVLLWVVRSCFNLGASPQEREVLYHDIEPKRHRHRSRPRRYSHSSDISTPAPVIITDSSRARSSQRPAYVYTDDRGRGRKVRRYT